MMTTWRLAQDLLRVWLGEMQRLMMYVCRISQGMYFPLSRFVLRLR